MSRRPYLHVCRLMLLHDDRTRRLIDDEWTTVIHSFLPSPRSAHKRAIDVTRGLPFPDGSFTAAYVNHILEHLSADSAASLARELHRVIRPGGVVRVVVPDLEAEARWYLASLEAYLAERTDAAERRYRWAVLELIDQKVRTRPGGAMLRAFAAGDYDSSELRARFGQVFDEIGALRPATLRERLRGRNAVELGYGVARSVKRALWRGDVRRSAEAELWGWDRVSLELLLVGAGFAEYRLCAYDDSGMPEWERYDFDVATDGGRPREPSLYAEVRRP